MSKSVIRRHARKHLSKLYAAQNSLCYWCKSHTVILRNIEQEKIVEVRPQIVIWNEGEHRLTARIASIDHLKPLRDCGSNDYNNLVLSCVGCNSDRTQQTMKFESLCVECNGPKQKRRKLCATCSINKSRMWLVNNGWIEVATHGHHTKFIDPITHESHILKIACRIQGHRVNKPDFCFDVKLVNKRGPEEEFHHDV